MLDPGSERREPRRKTGEAGTQESLQIQTWLIAAEIDSAVNFLRPA
jgi:hypothetical protein